MSGRRPWTAGFAALCLGQFLGHQTGLTFSVLIPIVRDEWRMSAGQAGMILGAFQIGTLAAYVAVGLMLDRMRSKPMMVWSAALVGFGDVAFALLARDFASGLGLRLAVGILIGGLYLPALKHIAETIPIARRGAATGLYIAVINIAYAIPLLYIGALAPLAGWRVVMMCVGGAELAGALIMALKVPDVPLPSMGDGASRGVGQASRYLGDVLRNRPALRVIAAYTGHNWELFGMWGWMAPFMVAALRAQGMVPEAALARGGALAAAAIGVGAVGAVLGGRLSDTLGRARTATLMMGASLLCSAGIGWLFAAPTALVVAVGLLYGISALADSPAYPASLMELVPSRSLGGAFSLQMLFGWTATAVSPAVFGWTLDLTRSTGAAPAAQWGPAFGLLAIGPLIGILALRPLRSARGPRAGGGHDPDRRP